MKWMLENVEAVRVAAASGDAMFGTVDSWLIFNLTGGVDGGVHVQTVCFCSALVARLNSMYILCYSVSQVDSFPPSRPCRKALSFL